MQVGFDSFTYFSTMFKKYTGVTPNEYRKNLNVDTKRRVNIVTDKRIVGRITPREPNGQPIIQVQILSKARRPNCFPPY